MSTLLRIWTGIVAAVAGQSIALMIQIIGMMTVSLPVDYLMGLVTAFAVSGFVGVIVGPRTKKKTNNDSSHS